MIPSGFAAKWALVSTTERASAQSHFLDLRDLSGVEKPTDTGLNGTFDTTVNAGKPKKRLDSIFSNARDHTVVSEVLVRPPLFQLHFFVRNSDRTLPFVTAKLPQRNRKGHQAP